MRPDYGAGRPGLNMLNGMRRRLGWPGRRVGLPPVLLLLGLCALFLLGGDREYFYRGDVHDWNSSKAMALAENVFKHKLLIFFYRSRDADGRVSYPEPYSRFPVGGFVLIKLAMLPFGDTDFRAQIYAARLLMLLLFSVAVVLAYISLARITGSRWNALTATLLAFSSYYLLYYADMIFNEITIDLFAVMAVFHGMVIFIQEGRFRQLLVKSCAALLLGWHVYAFLLPFIVFGLAGELLKARRMSCPGLFGRLKQYSMALLRSRYLLLGIVTLILGIVILSFNFSNEYFALKGETPLRELPSVASALQRTGFANSSRGSEPEVFWPNQFYRVTMTTLPFAVNIFPVKLASYPTYRNQDYPAIVIGALTLIFCLAALAITGVRRGPGMTALLATLAVSGFCYATLLRHNVSVHNFESAFHVGLPLAAYTLALLCVQRMSRVRLAPFFAVAALAVFIFSVSAIAGTGQSRAELAVESEQMDDYAAIREAADDRHTIYLEWAWADLNSNKYSGAHYAAAYFLAGKTLIYADEGGSVRDRPKQAGDYLLLLARENSPALLTPANRHIFLYDWELYEEWRRSAE